MQWSFNLLNRFIFFLLTISLLFSYNFKARYINITISKSDTKTSYFNLFKNTFFKFFFKFRDSFLTKWSHHLSA